MRKAKTRAELEERLRREWEALANESDPEICRLLARPVIGAVNIMAKWAKETAGPDEYAVIASASPLLSMFITAMIRAGFTVDDLADAAGDLKPGD